MNEAELILAWGEISSHLWTVVQFWTSITFGVIAIGHFAPEHLNRFLVVFLSFLYALFTLFCASIFVADAQLLSSLYEEAKLLQSERGESAVFLASFVGYRPTLGALFIYVGFPSVFFGSIAYLIYRYRGARARALDEVS